MVKTSPASFYDHMKDEDKRHNLLKMQSRENYANAIKFKANKKINSSQL